MDIPLLEVESFSPKVEAAWNALQRQYASRITGAEIDHLFACFVLGLTSPAYAEGSPARHFDACLKLVGLQLPPERVRAALHAVPEPSEPWVERAWDLAEEHGAKLGMALAEEKRNRTDHTGAEADAAHRKLSGGAEEQVG